MPIENKKTAICQLRKFVAIAGTVCLDFVTAARWQQIDQLGDFVDRQVILCQVLQYRFRHLVKSRRAAQG